MKFELSCCICSKDELVIEVDTKGWVSVHGDEISEEDFFCPEHAIIERWCAAQCPGCVAGWGECGLWRAFAYTKSEGLTEDQYQSIADGVCPFRINGSMTVDTVYNLIEKSDISEIGSNESGECLVNAIKEYRRKEFPMPENNVEKALYNKAINGDTNAQYQFLLNRGRNNNEDALYDELLHEVIETNTLDSIIEALKETYDIDDIIIALTEHGADHEAIAQIQILVDSVSLDTSGEDI